MDASPTLFQSLYAEWPTLGRSPAARAALARWAADEPHLAGFEDPAALVERTRGAGSAEANAMLAAVLRRATGDEVAVRTLLQAALPGLASLVRRCAWLADADQGVWQGRQDLAADVVVLAYERIRALAGADRPWPATAILDGVWRALRHTIARHRRRQERWAVLDATRLTEPDGRPAGAELAETIVAFVRSGALRRPDASVVYQTRVAGRSVGEVAARSGRTPAAVYKHRERAEAALVEAGRFSR